MKHDNYVVGIARPWYFSRWWIKTRTIVPTIYDNGLIGAPIEFYVPWYSWPLELLYRGIFGKVTLEKD